MSIAEKLLQIAENTPKVYDKGYEEGYYCGSDFSYNEGYREGYDNGYGEGNSMGFQSGYDLAYGIQVEIIQKLIQHQVEEIDIPEGTTRLGAYCFAYCSNLRRVSIPESVTLVDSSAFVGTNITGELVLPIACSTYYGSSLANTKFTSMKLGNARIIQRQAFENNAQCLVYDFTRNTQVPTIEGAYVFRGINANAKILVPSHLYDDWIVATNWVEWADYIVVPPGIITFSIDGVEYTAEEGMTWGEWVESKYNTIGAAVVGDSVYADSFGVAGIVNNNDPLNLIVVPTEEIIANGSYRA